MIRIDLIPHKEQRYDTVGDWQFLGGSLFINISNLHHDYPIVKMFSTMSEEQVLAIHELVEAILCKARGISQEVVDKWDLEHKESSDPGSIPGCPYYREHMTATMIERVMAYELEIDWDEYERLIENVK